MKLTPSRARVVGFVFCVVLIVLSLGTVTTAASAQELPGDDSADNDSDGTQVADQMGDLVIHSYSYDARNKQFNITATWRGSIPEQLTITELLELDSSGSTQISFKEVRLLPDQKTTITVAAEKRDGTAAVLLTTPQSVQNQSALVLQSGDVDRGPVPFGMASVLIGLAAVGGAAGAFAFTARSYRDDEAGERRERIA